jgi:hypothetical protein
MAKFSTEIRMIQCWLCQLVPFGAKQNDVTKLSHDFTAAQTCEIRGIIDAGPMSNFR